MDLLGNDWIMNVDRCRFFLTKAVITVFVRRSCNKTGSATLLVERY